MTTKLTAADLVVGQSYLVRYGFTWHEARFVLRSPHHAHGLLYLFDSVVPALGSKSIAEERLGSHVRPLGPQTFPDPPPDETAALWQRILELEEEVRRNSWRPVSEKPEDGDADAEGYLPCIWGRPDGTTFMALASLENVRDAEATATPGCNRITHWRPVNLPPITEDQKFARWKAAASEEDRDAAMRAGWKGGAA